MTELKAGLFYRWADDHWAPVVPRHVKIAVLRRVVLTIRTLCVWARRRLRKSAVKKVILARDLADIISDCNAVLEEMK